MQADKKVFEENAKARATANSSSRYGQQEVCQISGLIINSEETRVRDHKMGRNYRCQLMHIYSPALLIVLHTLLTFATYATSWYLLHIPYSCNVSASQT